MRHGWSRSLVVFALGACSGSPHDGFDRVAADVDLKLHVLGDSEARVGELDSVLLRVRAAHLGAIAGSYMSTERWFAVQDLRSGAFNPIMERMHEGDSMSMIAPAGLIPWSALAVMDLEPLADTVTMRLELSLRSVRTPAQMEVDAQRHRRLDPAGFGHKVMAAYLEHSKQPWTQWGTSDLHYIIRGTATDTNRVVAGQQVTISYEGSRVDDGRVFDGTNRNGAPFSFRFGDPDQVIKGLEVAVHLLREGQEGEFLFPDSMAFGAKGIPGVLDPYMPVRYTVRLQHVERSMMK